MISDDINLRPNCNEISRIRKFWALDLQQLKKLASIHVNELKTSDKTFYSNFNTIAMVNQNRFVVINKR